MIQRNGRREWDRTTDHHHVKVVLYRRATRLLVRRTRPKILPVRGADAEIAPVAALRYPAFKYGIVPAISVSSITRKLLTLPACLASA